MILSFETEDKNPAIEKGKLKDSFKYRAEQLKQRCRIDPDYKTVFTAKDHELSHILVNLDHKFLYCGIPKTGEMDWRRVFYKLSGKTKETDLSQIPTNKINDTKNFLLFHHLSNENKSEVIREYKKFIVIRNPFERILSVYEKIFKASDHSETIEVKWVKAMNKYIRKNKTKSEDITFEEFLKFVFFLGSKNAPKDLAYFVNQKFHLTIHDLCFPCNIQYNLIGDFTNLVDDSNYVLQKIGANFSFPTKSSLSETRRWIDTGRYYSQIERDVLLKITQYYIADMNLFGYSGVNLNNNDEINKH
jgi:hypothetical protein